MCHHFHVSISFSFSARPFSCTQHAVFKMATSSSGEIVLSVVFVGRLSVSCMNFVRGLFGGACARQNPTPNPCIVALWKKTGCVWWRWWWMRPYGGIAGVFLAAAVTAGDIHHIVLRQLFKKKNIPSSFLVLFSAELEDKKGEGSGVCLLKASTAKIWWRS